MRTSALFGAKSSKVLKSMVYLDGTMRVEQCGHFSDKGWVEVIFCDFVRTFFMDDH